MALPFWGARLCSFFVCPERDHKSVARPPWAARLCSFSVCLKRDHKLVALPFGSSSYPASSHPERDHAIPRQLPPIQRGGLPAKIPSLLSAHAGVLVVRESRTLFCRTHLMVIDRRFFVIKLCAHVYFRAFAFVRALCIVPLAWLEVGGPTLFLSLCYFCVPTS